MEVMTLKQAAAYLSMSKEVLRRQASQGKIPGRRLGESVRSPWRFTREELDDFMLTSRDKRVEERDIIMVLLGLMEQFREAKGEEEQVDIIKSISNFEHEIALGFFCKNLLDSSSSEVVIYWSIYGLISLLGEDADVYLESFLKHESDWIRLMVADFFATELGDESAAEQLASSYKKTGSFLALSGLMRCRPEEYWSDFSSLLKSETSHERYLAVRKLHLIEHEQISGVLVDLIRDSDARIQNEALELINERYRWDFREELERFISEDHKFGVKQKAVKILSEIYEEEKK